MKQEKKTPRIAAIYAKEPFYDGKPCTHCGNTKRGTGSGNCNNCQTLLNIWRYEAKMKGDTFIDPDEEIAVAMWKSDDRPCKWYELTADEQEEWLVMARAAKTALLKQGQ